MFTSSRWALVIVFARTRSHLASPAVCLVVASQVMNRSTSLLALFLFVLALGAGSCSGNGNNGNQAFVVRITQGAVDTSLRIEVSGNWIVYFEDENPVPPAVAPGSLNGDADDADAVPVVVSVTGDSIFPLDFAARAAHIVDDEIYFEVVEADDDFDWNGDMFKDDLVLVHWSSDMPGVPNGAGMSKASGAAYVDDLDPAVVAPARSAIAHGTNLYYTKAISDLALGMLLDGDTSLNRLASSAPLTPMIVTHTDLGQRRPRIVSADPDGILVLAYDETIEMAPLNAGDGDMTDTAVLALLDATNPTRGIKCVERAIPLRMSLATPAFSPVRARLNDAGTDWLVGFFVSEADEGGASLNDAMGAQFMGTAWNPMQCTARDTDATDSVLGFLHFEAWFADSAMNPPRNTGLTGRTPGGIEPDRLVIVEGFLATVSDESSAACNLNVDMDTNDGIVRWTDAPTDPMADILPPGAAAELHALAVSLPGPSEGLASVDNRFVIVASELMDDDDINMVNGKTEDLVGWLDPADAMLTTWTFMHGANFVGASWMTDEPRVNRLAIAFQESVFGTSLNSACKSISFADGDTDDEIPTFARFSATDLIFPGVGLAMSPANPGMFIDESSAYFRVSEAAQGTDINGDGDSMDFVLVRNSLFSCDPILMGTTTNPAGGDDLLLSDGVAGAAFIASETDARLDLNNNGNIGEDVVLFFGLP